MQELLAALERLLSHAKSGVAADRAAVAGHIYVEPDIGGPVIADCRALARGDAETATAANSMHKRLFVKDGKSPSRGVPEACNQRIPAQ